MNRVCPRTQLRMALDANIVRAHKVKPGRIHNAALFPGSLDVLASRPVAALAAHIPLRHGPGCNVVIHGMAAIAQRAGGPLHGVVRIVWCPPVFARAGMVLQPDMVNNIPLYRQRIVMVAALDEVPLLPVTAVDESNILLAKFIIGIRLGEIAQEGLRMRARVLNHVRHPRIFPSVVDREMTGFAGLRANIASASGGSHVERCQKTEQRKRKASMYADASTTEMALRNLKAGLIFC